ncbi:MAG: hypothetical protein V1873_04105 [Verrucomicrobiota bacterium]
MNISRWLVVAGAVALLQIPALAGPLTGSVTMDSGIEARNLDRLSVGLDAEMLQRDVEPESGGVMELKAQQASAFLGVDLFPWLAIYGTAGAAEAKLGDMGDYGDAQFKWSAGLNANIWHWEDSVKDPSWGLTIKAVGEFSQYESGDENNKVEWDEISAALPLSYEIYFATYPEGWADIDTLMIYAGPAFSAIDGTRTMKGAEFDFSESESAGILGGLDLFFTDSLSLRGQVEFFDSVIYSASLRYHFH